MTSFQLSYCHIKCDSTNTDNSISKSTDFIPTPSLGYIYDETSQD